MIAKRKTRGLYASGLFAAAVLASLSAQAAAPSLAVLVQIPGKDDKVLEQLDGDALPTGAKYRLSVTPSETGPLSVGATGGPGSDSPSLTLEKPTPGKSVELPSGGGWYTLGAGEVEIVAAQEGGRTRHVLRPVNTVPAVQVASLAPSNETLELGSGAQKNPAPAFNKILAATKSFDQATSRLLSFRDPALRGGLGAKVFREAGPGVVLIVADEGIGSGVILSERGDILTNSHVVGDAKSVGVILKPPSGQLISPSDVHEAKLVRLDQVSDMALIQLEQPPKGLVSLKLGDQASLEIGASVHAIGHPLGEYWTYTQGVVSQIRPSYTWTGPDGLKRTATVVQTQTPINPGNSGGPLLDDNVTVVGINSFGDPEHPGINFAVSVDDMRKFLASSEDRLATHVPDKPAATAAAPAGCKPRSSVPVVDPILKKRVVAFDTLCGGFANLYLIGEKPDGSPEIALIDNVGDKKVDIQIIFGFQPGVDLWIFYAARDGVATGFGYDFGGKGKPERYVAINAGHR